MFSYASIDLQISMFHPAMIELAESSTRWAQKLEVGAYRSIDRGHTPVRNL